MCSLIIYLFAQLHFCNCPLGQTEGPLLQSLTCDITACGLINHRKYFLEPKPEVFSPETWDGGGGSDLYTIISLNITLSPQVGMPQCGSCMHIQI